MPQPQFDRHQLRLHALGERPNKVQIEQEQVLPGSRPARLEQAAMAQVRELAERMQQARAAQRPVMLAFGAHAIKNGLGPLLIRLMAEGWVSHLATNGAGIIHDWEFAYQGQSSEDVKTNVAEGRFGLWQETGFNINLALLLGALDGLGYGESVGRLIEREAHHIPSREQLLAIIQDAGRDASHATRAAAAADVLAVLSKTPLTPGVMPVRHPWKAYSVQAAAVRLGVPCTGHPMFGHDIIYTHPLNHGAAIGRTAERDFLAFAQQVAQLEGGVYLSVGSAVMSPMVFEKSLSMAQNLALQHGPAISRHYLMVVDLAKGEWDWSQGEPPATSPAYYLRYCKTFSRMGGTMRYLSADNRDFFLALCQVLEVN
jgi:hypothetical protein